MSQLAPIVFKSTPPALSTDLFELAQQNYLDAFTGFESTGRWLRCGVGHFKLKGNGTEEVIPGGALAAVFLRANPENHCLWNQRQYAAGQEPEAPDLIWMHRPGYFPDALPAQFRDKVSINGAERWGFRIRRRTVWALAQIDTTTGNILDIDFDNPFVFDVSASSLFGKSLPEIGQYKWSGLAAFCKQHSGNGFVCTPSMFLTRILQDPNATVVGIVNFQPLVNPNTGNIQYLPDEFISKALHAAVREDVVELAKVTEKLDFDGSGTHTAAPVMQSMPQPAPQVQQPVAPVQPMPQPASQAVYIPHPTESVQAKPASDVTGLIDEAADMFGATLVEPSDEAQEPEETDTLENSAKKVTDSSVLDLLSSLG